MFPWTVIELESQGPRAGDESLEDVVAGIDTSSEEVKYTDPNILVKIFPELFPYGVGAFQLRHSTINLRGQDSDNDEPMDGPDEGDASLSIKMYAKYRLLHFDRTFAVNTRFVVYMHNWIRKAVVHGYRARSTTSTRQGIATTVAHVLQGNQMKRQDSRGDGKNKGEINVFYLFCNVRNELRNCTICI